MEYSQKKPIERLATALQDCFNEAARIGIREVQEVEARMNARLDKQDATLKMVWKQVEGTGPLPIDED